MVVYHIVLQKLKPGVTQEQLDELERVGKAMVGQIPGLRDFQCNRPLPITAHRNQGYDHCIVAIMDDQKTLEIFGPHPAHQVVHDVRIKLAAETLAYDMEV